ncbi:MAG TPA: zf-HC2 domain-containing protein [Acidobacteriota bacterium]
MKMRCNVARKNISLAMDNRLAPPGHRALSEHLLVCPSCRSWQQEQSQLSDLLSAAPEIRPAPGFYAALRDRLDFAPPRRQPLAFSGLFFQPALLRAAMVLLLVFSAALGFILGGRLDEPAADTDVAVFSRTMNLDAFADLPADSFGAAYDRLLQGKLQ